MTGPGAWDLTLPGRERLAAPEAIRLLEAALERRPDEADRLRLARLYIRLGRVEAAADRLREWPTEGALIFPHAMSLAHVQLALDAPERAAESINIALAAAQTPDRASAAEAALGKALFKLGKVGEARHALRNALRTDTGNSLAYTRLADLETGAGGSASLLDVSRDADYRNSPSSGMLAARVLALSHLDRSAEAAELSGCDGLLHCETVPVPDGWANLAAFNRALADEIRANPSQVRPVGTRDMADRLRTDDLMLERARLFPVLAEILAARVKTFVASIAGERHIWMTGRPAAARLRFWSMVTRGEAHDPWHMHHKGWLSGVYYVQVPRAGSPAADGGGIGFGSPAGSGAERRLIHPQAGQLLLFPSHLYHRTHPSGDKSARISVAFDVQPLTPPGAES